MLEAQTGAREDCESRAHALLSQGRQLFLERLHPGRVHRLHFCVLLLRHKVTPTPHTHKNRVSNARGHAHQGDDSVHSEGAAP